MVKQQVNVVVLVINGNAPLAGDEAEAFAHLQQEVLQVVKEGCFQLRFRVELPPLQPSGIQTRKGHVPSLLAW